MRCALDFKVKGTRKWARQMETWLIAVMLLNRKVGLKESDVNNRSRYRLWVNAISCMTR